MRRDEHLSAMPHKNTYLHLHFDSKFELKYSGQIELGRRFAKISIRDAQVIAAKAHIVKKVERVSPENKPKVLANLEIPGDTQILVKEMGKTKAVRTCRRSIAVCERCR